MALSTATQHAMPPEFDGQWEIDFFNGERSVLTLGSQARSAWLAVCGIQREAKKKIIFNPDNKIFAQSWISPLNTQYPKIERELKNVVSQHYIGSTFREISKNKKSR